MTEISSSTASHPDWRSQFKSVVIPFQKHQKKSFIILGGAFVVALTFLVFAMPKSAAVAFVIGYLAFIAHAMMTPKLPCPACQQDLEVARLGDYCPDCGARETIPKKEVLTGAMNTEHPKCTSCGTKFTAGRSGKRIYRIRFCTHCGVFLDDKGLR
jgi:transposase-like protein